jgi:hypothetical protein
MSNRKTLLTNWQLSETTTKSQLVTYSHVEYRESWSSTCSSTTGTTTTYSLRSGGGGSSQLFKRCVAFSGIITFYAPSPCNICCGYNIQLSANTSICTDSVFCS